MGTVKKILKTLAIVVFVCSALAVITPIFFFDQFKISGNSMEPTLTDGDHVLVNKLLFGARIYKDYDFSKESVQSFRMPGIRGIKAGDIAVFNSPDGRNNKRIGFKINYVYAKRCIGTPGDTVYIKDGYYFNYNIIGPVGELTYQHELSKADEEFFKENNIYFKAGNFAGRKWTIKDFGPYYIPKAGQTIGINPSTVKQYAKVIEYESGQKPEIKDGKVYIHDTEISEYSFKNNYYFFGGDNVLNSRDSRYIGLVPEEFIVGIASRILFSKNEQGFDIKRCMKSLKYQSNFTASQKLEDALALAQGNKSELIRALNNYTTNQDDSLKLGSAIFLIENMPGHSYYVGDELDRQLNYFSILRKAGDQKIHPQALFEKFKKNNTPLNLSLLQKKDDITSIDSAYLCSNIEWAFKVWTEMPWGKYIKFDDFKNYILPYRVGNEALTYWREDYYNQHIGIIKEYIKESGDKPVFCAAAAVFLYKKLGIKPFYTSLIPAHLPHVGPETAKYRCGTCRELSDFNLYLLRSLGIPCSTDYMPIRGNDNPGHSWSAMWNHKGEVFCEDSGEIKRASKTANYKSPKIKVYRTSFVKGMEKDVTKTYSPRFLDTLSITYHQLYNNIRRNDTLSLAASKRLTWIPLVKGKTIGKNICFDDICTGSVMRVVATKEEKMKYCSDPFYVNKDSTFHFFTAKDSLIDITTYSRYPVEYETHFRQNMIGGIFEGSNTKDFSVCDTLHTITRISKRLIEKITINNDKKYRYIRYRGKDGSWSQIAEIALYGEDSNKPLTGKIIGTPGCPEGDGTHEYTKAFDGNTATSFKYKEASGGWTGIDLGEAKNITQIHYSPANRDNYVKPGEEYELYYCDKVWKSAGRQTASSDSLLFEDIPAGTLYLLKILSEGQQMRIFSYENGKQVWR